MIPSRPPRLHARTVPIEDPGDLLRLVPTDADPSTVVAWVREGDGLIGWGHIAGVDTSGIGRFDDAEAWWQRVVADAVVEDPVGMPGSGLVSFGSFTFSPGSSCGSILRVPQTLVGRRHGRTWLTSISTYPQPVGPRPVIDAVAPPAAAAAVALRDGAVSAQAWPALIARAISRIGAGEVEKVVLARDVVAEIDGPPERRIELRQVLDRLGARYGATWTFAVDGLVGATPEMLVRLEDGLVRSRVLAGTVRRDQSPGPSVTEAHPELSDRHPRDPRLRLVSSDKELEEHAFAVRSVAEALAPHCAGLEVPPEPFVLELPDVYHLASDLTGSLAGGATSLRLAAALHPSAAVCGTPSAPAARLITELEGMDRERYAGPVGWMDAAGDGDWGIALRCGQLAGDRRSMRLFAGGGIVGASDPETELAETEVKLAAMRHALGG